MDSSELGPSESPPADPEEWTDTQWIEWLKATDSEFSVLPDDSPATTSGRIVHSVGGQAVGQVMLGLARAIYGQRDDNTAVVIEAGGEPEKDRPFRLHLDVDHPERSFVVLEPGAERAD